MKEKTIMFHRTVQFKEKNRAGIELPKEWTESFQGKSFDAQLGTTGTKPEVPIVRLEEKTDGILKIRPAGTYIDNKPKTWLPMTGFLEHLDIKPHDAVEFRSWNNEIIINRITKREKTDEINKNMNTWKKGKIKR